MAGETPAEPEAGPFDPQDRRAPSAIRVSYSRAHRAGQLRPIVGTPQEQAVGSERDVGAPQPRDEKLRQVSQERGAELRKRQRCGVRSPLEIDVRGNAIGYARPRPFVMSPRRKDQR